MYERIEEDRLSLTRGEDTATIEDGTLRWQLTRAEVRQTLTGNAVEVRSWSLNEDGPNEREGSLTIWWFMGGPNQHKAYFDQSTKESYRLCLTYLLDALAAWAHEYTPSKEQWAFLNAFNCVLDASAMFDAQLRAGDVDTAHTKTLVETLRRALATAEHLHAWAGERTNEE